MSYLNVITIDGPAAAGKSTIAKKLSKMLDWQYLDTGALYRAIAVTVKRHQVNVSDQIAVEKLASSVSVQITNGGNNILVDNEDVTADLRTADISSLASAVAAWPGVRSALLGLQQKIGDKGCLVADGRDMGTVVFPKAITKFFLSASQEARAERRYQDLLATGAEVKKEDVLADILKRDEADEKRSIAPLKAAEDAIIIDSTNYGIEKVAEMMLEYHKNMIKAIKVLDNF